jgi:hypothetical protein
MKRATMVAKRDRSEMLVERALHKHSLGRVTYRGNSLDAATAVSADLVIFSKLLVMYQCCSGSCILGLDSSTRLHFYYLVFTEISVTRESLVSSHQWSPQRPR